MISTLTAFCACGYHSQQKAWTPYCFNMKCTCEAAATNHSKPRVNRRGMLLHRHGQYLLVHQTVHIPFLTSALDAATYTCSWYVEPGPGVGCAVKLRRCKAATRCSESAPSRGTATSNGAARRRHASGDICPNLKECLDRLSRTCRALQRIMDATQRPPVVPETRRRPPAPSSRPMTRLIRGRAAAASACRGC